MKPDHSTSNTSLPPGWQILGELDLHLGRYEDSGLHDWLTKIAGPLDLHLDFLGKVLASARDAITRAGHAGSGTEPARLRFRVLAPARPEPKGSSWGFFRLEKLNGAASPDPAMHTIEIYLYLES